MCYLGGFRQLAEASAPCKKGSKGTKKKKNIIDDCCFCSVFSKVHAGVCYF
jgi:hypothetical protein